MEIKDLQKKLIVKGVIYLAALIGIIIISVYLDSAKTKINERRDWLKNDIFSLKKKIDGLGKRAVEFSDVVKTWEGLDEEQRKLQGLRINHAKDLLDKFKADYNLANMNVSFSKPDELKDKYVSETVAVIESNVSIGFSALTDEGVFNFIAAVINDFPGYVQIKSLSVNRSKEITKSVLESIAKGENPGMVEVKLEFAWRDLKYKGPAAVKKEEENES